MQEADLALTELRFGMAEHPFKAIPQVNGKEQQPQKDKQSSTPGKTGW